MPDYKTILHQKCSMEKHMIKRTIMFFLLIVVFQGTLFPDIGVKAQLDFTTSDRIPKIMSQLEKEIVTNLPQGVIFKKTGVLDMSSSSWPHIFKIPHIPALPTLPPYKVCEKIPDNLFYNIALDLRAPTDPKQQDLDIITKVSNRVKNRLTRFCEAFTRLENNYKILLNQTRSEVDRQFTLMNDLVLPNKRVEPATPIQPPVKPPVAMRQQAAPSGDEIPYLNIQPPMTTPKPRHPKDTMDLDYIEGKTLNRTSREAFSFLGNTLGHFFGLSNTKDLKKLWSAINYMQTNIEDLAGTFNKFADQMITMSKLEKDRVDNLAQQMTIVTQDLTEIKERLRELHITEILDAAFEEMVNEIFIEAFQAVSMLQDATHNYLAFIQERCLTLVTLNNHLLSPSLVTPAELKKTLADIEQVLLRDYAPFRFAFTSLDYFYSIPSTSYLADDEYLYVEIKIPLTILSAHYQVYEVRSVPMAVGKGDTQYTQMKGLSSHVAFSAQGDTYALLDDTFLNTCEGTGIQRCHQRKMESSTLVPTCVLALFIDDLDMIQKHCKADFILTPSLPETAIDIGHGNFFISAMNTSEHWTISCSGRKPRALVSCKSCIIALDCKCNLKTPSSFISASLDNCPEATSSSGLTKTNIPNLTWLQNLPKSSMNFTRFKETLVKDHDADEFIMEEDIPTYEEIAPYVDYDKEVRTGLEHIMAQAENRQRVYVSQYQRLSEEAEFMGFRVNYAFPLSLASLAWNAVLTFLLITVFKKGAPTALLSGLTTGLTKAKSVGASPVYPSEADHTQSFCLWYIAVVLSAYVLLVLTWKLLKHKKQRKCVSEEHYPIRIDEAIMTRIYLKFWTPFRLVIIRADEILAAKHDLTLDTDDSKPREPISLDFDFRLYRAEIKCNWKNIILKHNNLNIKIPLPENITVTSTCRIALSHIVGREFSLAMILKTGPDQTTIPLEYTYDRPQPEKQPMVIQINAPPPPRVRSPFRPIPRNYRRSRSQELHKRPRPSSWFKRSRSSSSSPTSVISSKVRSPSLVNGGFPHLYGTTPDCPCSRCVMKPQSPLKIFSYPHDSGPTCPCNTCGTKRFQLAQKLKYQTGPHTNKSYVFSHTHTREPKCACNECAAYRSTLHSLTFDQNPHPPTESSESETYEKLTKTKTCFVGDDTVKTVVDLPENKGQSTDQPPKLPLRNSPVQKTRLTPEHFAWRSPAQSPRMSPRNSPRQSPRQWRRSPHSPPKKVKRQGTPFSQRTSPKPRQPAMGTTYVKIAKVKPQTKVGEGTPNQVSPSSSDYLNPISCGKMDAID